MEAVSIPVHQIRVLGKHQVAPRLVTNIIVAAQVRLVPADMFAQVERAKCRQRKNVLLMTIALQKKHVWMVTASLRTDNRLQTKEAPSSGGFFVLFRVYNRNCEPAERVWQFRDRSAQVPILAWDCFTSFAVAILCLFLNKI